MFKKVGIVTVGITAGLLAAAPFASAGEDPGHGGHEHSDHHGDHGDHHQGDPGSCSVVGGEAGAEGGNRGDTVGGNLVGQLPIGGNNVGNIVCDDIVTHNLNDNHLRVNVLGEDDGPNTLS